MTGKKDKTRLISETSEGIKTKYKLPHLQGGDVTDGGFGPWDDIVEKSMVGTGIMKDGAIVDREGKIYGINDSFHFKKKQIKPIVQALFGDGSVTDVGLQVGDRMFKNVKCENGDSIVGTDGDGGIIIKCTRNYIIIGIYDAEKKKEAEEMMVDLQQYFNKQNI